MLTAIVLVSGLVVPAIGEPTSNVRVLVFRCGCVHVHVHACVQVCMYLGLFVHVCNCVHACASKCVYVRVVMC